MELPASHYGSLDKRNPVIIGFVRDINSFIAVMNKAASSPAQERNSGRVKGIKMLMEMWKKYKHRLQPSLYQKHMLRVADVLLQLKFHDMALWYGYSLHLKQYTSVGFLDIEDMDHFKACFFPEGVDKDQDVLLLKIRALQGCARCTLQHIKDQDILTPHGLHKLICVLDLIRVMMHVLQPYGSLFWQIYNGSVLIYDICHFLMTQSYSALALEYLLWASFNMELFVPLVTSDTLSCLVTLNCAVCECFYRNQAAVQGEAFAKRALAKINEVAVLEEQCWNPAFKDNQRNFQEAYVKLATMAFKRVVFEARHKISRFKTKRKVSELPNAPWPRSTTEQILSRTFKGGAAQFLGVLEALRDNGRALPQTGTPEDLDGQEVIVELLAAGISLLSKRDLKTDPGSSLSAVTTSSSLIASAIAGENKISIEAALEFIKLLNYYKQPEAFDQYSREMLHIFSCLSNKSFQTPELELRLLYDFNVQKARQKSALALSDEVIALVKTLHKCICCSDSFPNRDLALAVILFVWDNIASVIEKVRRHDSVSKTLDKGAWCLSLLCDVAFAFDLCSTNYHLMTGEMTLTLAMLLEHAAEQNHPLAKFEEDENRISSTFSLCNSSGTQLLQKLCELVKKWSNSFSKAMSRMLPQDRWALFDTATLQNYLSSQEEDDDNVGPNHTWSREDYLLVLDVHLYLKVIHQRATIRLSQDREAGELQILRQNKKNKISSAVFLMQKALMDYNMEQKDPNIKKLLVESDDLIRKAASEERKLYMSTIAAKQSALMTKGRGKEERDCPPPAPVLVSRSDHSLCFVPAPYSSEQQVCWYQLMGHSVDGVNLKVRLSDCTLTGTGSVIPVDCGQCVLEVKGLDPNQKYVFAVAAYNIQGDLVGNGIGESTIPILASPPLPILTTWGLLAETAFQTKQYDVAKRACQKLWSYFTCAGTSPGTPRLQVPMLRFSSLALRQSVFSSIFIETEINIHDGSLQCCVFSNRGTFAWEQMARLEECERMLVAIDLVPWLIDHSDALQAVIACYALLTPIIYHQIPWKPVIQVLFKCLKVLEKNRTHLQLKWTGRSSEGLMHRIACITYYLYKSLHNLQENDRGSLLMNCGVNLIQEIYDYQKTAMIKDPTREKKVSPQMRALLGKNKSKNKDDLSTITFSEEHSRVLSRTPISHAFHKAMKIKQKTLFIELSSMLLQRALEEGEAALVIEWEQSFLERLSDLTATRKTEAATVIEFTQDDARGKCNQGQFKGTHVSSEKYIIKTLNRLRKKMMLKKIRHEESVFRINLNLTFAQAHLILFHKALSQDHEAPLRDRYSQLDHLHFSMAYSGVPMRVQTNLQQLWPSRSIDVLEKDKIRTNEQRAQGCDELHSSTEGSNKSSLHNEQILETQQQIPASVLDSLTKAGQYLRRAMVLAHRNGHWAVLRSASQTVWDQYCRLGSLVQRGVHLELSFFITVEQHRDIFGPLLVLATQLIMDMLHQLGLWRVYERDLTEDEMHSSLYFSVTLDETTQIDMRWVKTVVIHTLELLHDCGKWECLAHLALLFNGYTRDHYAFMVSPFLINAQRKLLERITIVKGPPVPQPHHIKTKEVTGHEVTYKNYMGTQLLSGWTSTQKVPNVKKRKCSRGHLKESEAQRSLALVCVPLDVEDTLFWYRKAVEKRSSCLEVFQHCRSHLLRLLANTQPCYMMPREDVGSAEPRSVSMGEFSSLVRAQPSVDPCDQTAVDHRTVDSLYSLPLSQDNIPIITAEYIKAIKLFREEKCHSLTVVALHELGNLQYYNGSTKAAHSCWAKAISTALKSPDALEKWDGVTFGDCSLTQRLKVSGVWGCLQAACLAAKIAEYILTRDISKRTDLCLLSAHLFKCVLCCSLAQPQDDLHYASGHVIHELLPGVGLFSDPSRTHLGTAVTSLRFLCQWLFSTGHYIKLLPVLALHLHCVSSVGRDVQRTMECKMLKIRTLTELGLFTEAVRETVLLTKGAGLCLPHGCYIRTDRDQIGNEFTNSTSILDNIEVLEELINGDFTAEVSALCGPTLCLYFALVRAQLILAISATMRASLQVPDEHTVSTELKLKDGKLLNLESLRDHLTVGQLKYLLLEVVSWLLTSVTEQLTGCSQVDRDELAVESSLLMSKLHLQRGQAALGAEMAKSSLVLLQANASHKQPVAEGNQHCLESDCVQTVYSSDTFGCLLWTRCRLTLVHCLTSHGSHTHSSKQDDNQLKRETAQMIRDGIEECKRWRDPYNEAVLMLEGATLDGSTADKSSQVKDIVCMISERPNMPPHSTITLARATMLLNYENTPESITFLKLSQKLLQNQLCSFSPNATLEDGESHLPCSSNTCLPFLHLLLHTSASIGQLSESPR